WTITRSLIGILPSPSNARLEGTLQPALTKLRGQGLTSPEGGVPAWRRGRGHPGLRCCYAAEPTIAWEPRSDFGVQDRKLEKASRVQLTNAESLLAWKFHVNTNWTHRR